jgi:crotonobetainyl-CoA:carnitine CoA-transferase CaiB-like acyl-CoA transferase
MTKSPANRRYGCSTGEIAIKVMNAKQWHALAVCLGRPELAYEGDWEAVRNAPPDGPIAAVVAEMFAEDTAESWAERLKAHDVPFELISDSGS